MAELQHQESLETQSIAGAGSDQNTTEEHHHDDPTTTSTSTTTSFSDVVSVQLDHDDGTNSEAVAMAYRSILASVKASATKCNMPVPRLVAVSKTKPISMIANVYNEGCHHFGENYVQEIVAKAADPELKALLQKGGGGERTEVAAAEDSTTTTTTITESPEIKWHFIGQLQSNKAKLLVTNVPGLWMIESVDSAKLATLLDKACASNGRGNNSSSSGSSSSTSSTSSTSTEDTRLRVLVQVNTSGEPQKGGVEFGKGEAAELATHIQKTCPHLRFSGLMTIGKIDAAAPGEEEETHPSLYFKRLVSEKQAVMKALGILEGSPEGEQFELSMGMSGDYVVAIEYGATSVRVGSSIFGARNYNPPSLKA